MAWNNVCRVSEMPVEDPLLSAGSPYVMTGETIFVICPYASADVAAWAFGEINI